MNFPNLTILKGFKDTGAAVKIAMRLSRNFVGHEESNEEYEKFIRAEERLKKLIKKSEDKRAIVMYIDSGLPGLRSVAIERAKELDLDALDLLDIFNVRDLSIEDQQDFFNMWSEQSNIVEIVMWSAGLINVNPVTFGRSLQEVSVIKVLGSIAAVATPLQLAFSRLYRLYQDSSPK